MMEEFIVDLDALQHYGTKYHSGRYPYGSGEKDGTEKYFISESS